MRLTFISQLVLLSLATVYCFKLAARQKRGIVRERALSCQQKNQNYSLPSGSGPRRMVLGVGNCLRILISLQWKGEHSVKDLFKPSSSKRFGKEAMDGQPSNVNP